MCLRFAVAAALTGTFSLADAGLTFLWMAISGVGLGVGIAWGTVTAKNRFSRHFGDDSGSNILVSLLIPFAAYLVAEHVESSGVLAAAAAGIAMSFTNVSSGVRAAIRIRRQAVWDMLQFTLNGIIFVLLGEQLPQVFAGARATVMLTGHDSLWWLGLYVWRSSPGSRRCASPGPGSRCASRCSASGTCPIRPARRAGSSPPCRWRARAARSRWRVR